MTKGLYAGYTGMLNQQYRLDTITNNLANASTVGYKREGATSKSFEDVMAVKIKDSSVGYNIQNIGNLNLGVKIGENYTDYRQGSLRETGNVYDLALTDEGFFKIAFTNKAGEESIKYTRDGNFMVDASGALRTKDGDYVLNDGDSRITVPQNSGLVVVDSLGQIYANGEYVDTLGIVDFEDYNYLEKYGENMYNIKDGGVEKEHRSPVLQGYLEMSNVNAVSEMVEMISITRAYEANQKAVQAADSMLEKSVNSVGTVG